MGMPHHHPYPPDLTEEQWAIIAPLFPPAQKLGRPRADLRRVFDAILDLLRTGCSWRMRPHDFSKGRTVDGHDREWTQTGLLEQILHVLRVTDRVHEGRSSEPTAAILDSQSIRTPEGGEARDDDAGKKITGAKAPSVDGHRRKASECRRRFGIHSGSADGSAPDLPGGFLSLPSALSLGRWKRCRSLDPTHRPFAASETLERANRPAPAQTGLSCPAQVLGR